jgi:hypothetical protein
VQSDAPERKHEASSEYSSTSARLYVAPNHQQKVTNEGVCTLRGCLVEFVPCQCQLVFSRVCKVSKGQHLCFEGAALIECIKRPSYM